MPSELAWAERGVRLTLDTRFPEEETLRIRVHAAEPARLALKVRVPYRAAGAQAEVNGEPLRLSASPGSHLSIERTWRANDVLTMRLPTRLHTAPMPDDPSRKALMYGPLVSPHVVLQR